MAFFYAFSDFVLDVCTLDLFAWVFGGLVVFWSACVILNILSGSRRSQ